jgi:hypothetical protein
LKKLIEFNPEERISWKELTEYPLMFLEDDDFQSPTNHLLNKAKAYYASEFSLPQIEAKQGPILKTGPPRNVKGSLNYDDDDFDFAISDEEVDEKPKLGLNYPSRLDLSPPIETSKLKTPSNMLLASTIQEQREVSKCMMDVECKIFMTLPAIRNVNHAFYLSFCQVVLLFQKLTVLKLEEVQNFLLEKSVEDHHKKAECEKVLEELHEMIQQLLVRMNILRSELLQGKQAVGDNDISVVDLTCGNTDNYSDRSLIDTILIQIDNDIYMQYIFIAEATIAGSHLPLSQLKEALAKLEGERRRDREIDGDPILPEGSKTQIAELLEIVERQISSASKL